MEQMIGLLYSVANSPDDVKEPTVDDMTYSGVMLVTTTPHAGVAEADFNAWYENIHVAEIRERVPGVEAVERFRSDNAGDQPPRYLAVYRISRPASAILADMRSAGLSDAAPMLDMVDNPPSIVSYDAVG